MVCAMMYEIKVCKKKTKFSMKPKFYKLLTAKQIRRLKICLNVKTKYCKRLT